MYFIIGVHMSEKNMHLAAKFFYVLHENSCHTFGLVMIYHEHVCTFSRQHPPQSPTSCPYYTLVALEKHVFPFEWYLFAVLLPAAIGLQVATTCNSHVKTGTVGAFQMQHSDSSLGCRILFLTCIQHSKKSISAVHPGMHVLGSAPIRDVDTLSNPFEGHVPACRAYHEPFQA
jgi:hypothetical protein